MSDFVIENGVLTRYTGPGGDVIIPADVTVIDDGAFYGCKTVTSVVVPEGVREIGTDTPLQDGAFAKCVNLTSVTLPQSLRVIGNMAFAGCKKLAAVSLPEELKYIGTGAFSGCSGLSSITIPHNAKFGVAALFDGCTGLREIINLREKPVLKEHIFADALSANDEGFYTNESLTDIAAPYKKGAIAFYLSHADRYTAEQKEAYEAYIKKQIGKLLADFIGAKNEAAVTKLLATGYATAAALKKAMGAAQDQPAFMALLLEYQNQNIDLAREKEKEEKAALRALSHVPTATEDLKKLWNTKKLPDGTLAITGYKGEEEQVVIPTQIGKSAVTAIGAKAFSLKPGSDNAQWWEERFTSVVIPEGITTIAKNAFRSCHALKEVHLPGTLTQLEEGAFECCRSLERIVIPQGITTVPRKAFANNWELKEAVIPEGVTTLEYQAFYYCENLQHLYLPATLENIERDVFTYSKNFTLHAPAGSYAHNYAKKKKIPFEEI